MTYDVFISYRSTDGEWVEILARNLKKQGYAVFFDIWEMIPGRDFVDVLYEGLNKSKKGIIVATPEALESGWVDAEYKQMLQRRQSDKDFTIIPVRVGEAADFPFMKSIHYVDFRNPADYRKSFYLLICGLEGRPPGEVKEFDGDLELPPLSEEVHIKQFDNEWTFADEIFELIFQYRTLIVLTRDTGNVKAGLEELLLRAKTQYKEKNVIHIRPPFSHHTEFKEYFSFIGSQAGFTSEIDSPFRFEKSLHQCLESLSGGEAIFLLISGFENGCDNGRQELAGMLRNLHSYTYNLYILILGGEKLAELKYASGDHSLLNHAEVLEWPELTVSDVVNMQREQFPHHPIDEQSAEAILKVSGGHSHILFHCLRLWNKNPDMTESDYYDFLINHSGIWQYFTQYRKYPDHVKRLCHLLTKQDLGPYEPYLFDPLLRTLYWNNLLRKKGSPGNESLSWRCKVIHDAGKRVLRCEE